MAKLIFCMLLGTLVLQLGVGVVKAWNYEIDMGGWFSGCGDTKYADGGKIKYTESVAWGTIDCEVVVETLESDDRYFIYFTSFDLQANNANCSDQKLAIYDGSSTSRPSLTGDLCGSTLPGKIRTSGDSFTIRLYRSESNSQVPKFSLYYSKISDDGDCFKCRNMTDVCIDHSLKCDDANNCPDRSDESYEEGGGCKDIADLIGAISMTILIVIIVCVVLGIVGCIVCIACIVCCLRKTSHTTTSTHTTVTAPAGTYPAQPVAGTYPQQSAPVYPQGGYAQPPAYPPAQGAYPPPQGGYPPPQGGYPAVNYNAGQQNVDMQEKV